MVEQWKVIALKSDSSKIKGPAELVSSGSCEGESGPCLSVGSYADEIFGIFWIPLYHPSLCCHVGILPVCLCVYIFLLTGKIDTSHLGLGLTLLLYDLILTNYICNDLFPNRVTITGPEWSVGLQYMIIYKGT